MITSSDKDIRPYKEALRITSGLLIVFVLLGSLAGCSVFKRKKEAPPAEKKAVVKSPEAQYQEVLNKWTSGIKLYEGFEAKLYMSATYKGPEFRKAYIQRYAAGYQLEEGYKNALLERELEQADKYNEFFFSAYTPDEKWNDFNQPNSVWKLYLEDNLGNRLSPVSISKVNNSDPLIREFFPYLDLWSTGYIVRFPKYSETGTEPIPGENTKFLKLIATGVLAKGELVWKLKD
ncbi:MAG: hypothetical protein HYS21_06485 [Deltaproteobacteria bacterium]|nr:hypothetical protein [Deltaproteobacteria bacterium]